MRLLKTIQLRLIPLMVLVTFMACEEQDGIVDARADILTESTAFLDFASRDDLEAAIQDNTLIDNYYTQSNQFTSLSMVLNEGESNLRTSSESDADSIYAEYGVLPKILNEDKIVKIGNYFIKVDLPNKLALVLESKFAGQYNDLANSNMRNKNIMVFSTDDEVLDLLERGSRGTSNGRVELLCGESGIDKARDYGTPSASNRKRLKANLEYQKAGIYFSIIIKGKAQKKKVIWVRDGGSYVAIGVNGSFRAKCQSTITLNNSIGDFGKASWRPWESTTALSQVSITADFSSSNGSTVLSIP